MRPKKEDEYMAEGGIVDSIRNYVMEHKGLGAADDKEYETAMNVEPSSDTVHGQEQSQHMADGGLAGFDVDSGDSDTLKGLPPNPASIPPAPSPMAAPPPAVVPMAAPPAPPPAARPMPGMPPDVTPDDLKSYLDTQRSKLNKYNPDTQYGTEMAMLKARTSPVGALSHAGSTFADALMQGVARAGNPGFAKEQEERASELGSEAAGAQERARKGTMENVEANQKVDAQDPSSPMSKAYQQAFAPIFAKMGYNPKAVAGMPASQIGSLADLGVRYADAQTQLELKKAMLQVQTLTAQATMSNQRSERHQEALKSLQGMPWYSRMMHPGISGALEKEAGLNGGTTEQAHGIPDLGGTFNGEKVVGVKKIK